MTSIVDLVRFVSSHFASRGYLERRVRATFGVPGFDFNPEVSGRTAIFKLARYFLAAGHRPVAILPDYLCNVVELAVRRAGFDIRYYRTDDLFEPDSDSLRRELETGSVGLLITSNVFGSSALLDHLPEDAFRRAVLSNGVAIIVDLCQDISLIGRLPSGYGNQLAAVISFNDKSFPSVMGGGMLAPFPVPASTRRLAWRQVLRLYWELGVKLISGSGLVPRRATESFEYSHCTRFPYTLELYRPAKLQYILALIGIDRLRVRNQEKLMRAHNLQVRRTRFFETSPFLVAESAAPPGRCKPSYARFGDARESLRPDLKAIHNKGFWDR